LRELGGIFDLPSHEKRIEKIQAEILKAGFWEDSEAANKVIGELKALKAKVEPWKRCQAECKELAELARLVEEEDKGSIEELTNDLERLSKKVHALELEHLLGGKHDASDVILSVNAGAGGTESCDWAQMLLRMYVRWAQMRGYETRTIDRLPAEEAGIRNATIIVKGRYAYGWLKSEAGVHRLVRISPFDAAKRRHTSFASVDVIPTIDETIEIKIDPKDLRIDTFRSSGPGGQHVNVTDSAVRITHLPTGIVCQCQNERSQHKNKAMAMKVLRAKLYEKRLREEEERLAKEYAKKMEIAWGSQIRSYIFHPYSLVKDHRTNMETSNAKAVMDGSLDRFMEAYLNWKMRR